jgi:inner membrane protease subunit 2
MFNRFWARPTWKNPLYWLPTGFVLSQYFYNVDVISGRSMQVAAHFLPSLAFT